MNTRFHSVRAGACLLLAASAALPFHAQAQEAADPQSAVPATRYQSALAAQPGAAPAATPDQNWIAGNQLVAATNSMALTMKTMAQSADPHAGHAGHAGMQGMNMGKQDSPAMCAPGDKEAGAGSGCKMPCCQSGCCCKDKMNKTDKPREAP